ncbi:hypothetical protein D3C76_1008330 [compost metagenome]
MLSLRSPKRLTKRPLILIDKVMASTSQRLSVVLSRTRSRLRRASRRSSSLACNCAPLSCTASARAWSSAMRLLGAGGRKSPWPMRFIMPMMPAMGVASSPLRRRERDHIQAKNSA